MMNNENKPTASDARSFLKYRSTGNKAAHRLVNSWTDEHVIATALSVGWTLDWAQKAAAKELR